jgi:hypothetical protein
MWAGDVMMWQYVGEQIWRQENVKIRRCADEQMWRWEEVKVSKINSCEYEKMMGKLNDVKINRCEDEKMSLWSNV